MLAWITFIFNEVVADSNSARLALGDIKMTLTKPVKAYKEELTGRLYTQCKLLRDGCIEKVGFIPSKFAVVGMTLKICGEDGWVVKETYQELDEALLWDLRNARKHHKEVSDV